MRCVSSFLQVFETPFWEVTFSFSSHACLSYFCSSGGAFYACFMKGRNSMDASSSIPHVNRSRAVSLSGAIPLTTETPFRSDMTVQSECVNAEQQY